MKKHLLQRNEHTYRLKIVPHNDKKTILNKVSGLSLLSSELRFKKKVVYNGSFFKQDFPWR